MRVLQHFRGRRESGDNLVLSLLRVDTVHTLSRSRVHFVNTDSSQAKAEPRRRWSAKTLSCDGPATDAWLPPPPASGSRLLPSVSAALIYGIS